MKKLINLVKYWLKIVPKWDKCVHASCWDGANAQRRMMNILSPKFTDAKFEQYVAWMEDRECDTAHVIFQNGGDGEGAGYSILNTPGFAELARKRIKYLRLHGFAVVGWLTTDDSVAYNKAFFKDPDTYVAKLKEAGLTDHLSYTVLGLEMDETGVAADWLKVQAAVKKYLPKMKIGVHHTSGHYTFASFGDIVLDQLDPARANRQTISASIGRILAMGKAAVGFEYSRHSDRVLAQIALESGAYACGNW